MSIMRIVLCSSTGVSSDELCLGSHGLKNVAVGMLQMDDALRARAERLKQMCNALANLHAYKLTTLGSRQIDSVQASQRQ